MEIEWGPIPRLVDTLEMSFRFYRYLSVLKPRHKDRNDELRKWYLNKCLDEATRDAQKQVRKQFNEQWPEKQSFNEGF